MVKTKTSAKKKEKTEKVKKSLSESEIKKEIIELAKQGLTAEKIGEKLRNQGIHIKENNIKISRVLKEENLYINPDLKNVQTKLDKIKSHYEKNKQDKRAMREKDRIHAHLRVLKNYFAK